jgi:hypothetical protein
LKLLIVFDPDVVIVFGFNDFVEKKATCSVFLRMILKLDKVGIGVLSQQQLTEK